MTTANQVELLLITISVTVLAVIAVAFLVELMVLLAKFKNIANKTEAVVTNLEDITGSIKDATKATTSKHSLMHLISKVFNSGSED
jgi:hypothetical protein